MHSIKKILFRVVLITGFLYLFSASVRFLYQSADTVAYYMNEELKEYGGTVDTLFCGTSTSYRGFSPKIWDEEMGGCSFNISTASQSLENTYVFMKQEIERNPVKRVFVGFSPKGMLKEESSALSDVRIYDSLKDPISRMSYLLKHVDLDEWLYFAYYPVRVEAYFDFEKIKANIKYKFSEDYKNYIFPKDTYQGRGYFTAHKPYEGEQVQHLKPQKGKWDTEQVNKREEEYLRKIIEYCGKNEIELILVWIPVTGSQVQKLGNAEEIDAYISSIVDEYKGNDVKFWNFLHYKNLVTEFTNDKFKDTHHLNGAGGEAFNRLLTRVYKAHKNKSNLKEYFTDICPYYQ